MSAAVGSSRGSEENEGWKEVAEGGGTRGAGVGAWSWKDELEVTPDAEDADAVEPRCSEETTPERERGTRPLVGGEMVVGAEGEARPLEGMERELDDEDRGRGARCWL